MLDSETKTRIDSARDILVGKVPDPKSQVEQITIALIYKFMDDMDRQSEELGGKASFFTGDFKKYRWAQLLDKRFSGHERLLLYAEGIEKMNQNKNIPQLFRDIFKGVFLPYRDPETLNLFLKGIDGFTYDHSERLGDAYEYLLSVLGTQGEAGQFRTPRHIIDFIVAVVDPKKHETVLDPACGTAGFLISAYKHILGISNFRILIADFKKGTEPASSIQDQKSKIKNDLTPDERARLMTNFRGYDIAPDMVRLSRANMYLHGFPNPVIYEYDTLTSEERWDERCDVVMANPPFMTPKGGIRPHNRFSIKAKRSEVLFVDYIAEHLNPGGRAGVIVPEGIIFQSQKAYKDLRRMLVKDYLWAVVSLPAGVFNPYSGVKTSILFFDRNQAKRTDEILFVKIENDGFDLGAQRRPIDGSQLPEALRILGSHKEAQKTQEGKMALTVPRKRLLESSDINLSGDRYRVAAAKPNGKWPMVKLGEVCDAILSGGTPSTAVAEYWNGSIPWITSADIVDVKTAVPRRFITEKAIDNSATNLIPAGNVIVVTRVGLGKLFQNSFEVCISQDSQGLIIDKTKVMPEYLVFVLADRVQEFKQSSQGSTIQGVTKTQLTQLEFPLPPLVEQKRIVAELEGYRKVIEGARQILASYKPTIRIDPEWPTVKLGKVCEIRSGGTPSRSEKSFWNGDIPWVGSTVCKDAEITIAEEYITQEGLKNSAAKVFPAGTTLVALVGATIGKTGLLKFDSTTNQNIAGLYPKSLEVLEPIYLFHAVQMLYPTFLRLGEGKFRMANLSFVGDQEIPLPPLDTQLRIVAELEAERKLVEANRELIARMEAKIKAKLKEVWGEEATSVG